MLVNLHILNSKEVGSLSIKQRLSDCLSSCFLVVSVRSGCVWTYCLLEEIWEATNIPRKVVITAYLKLHEKILQVPTGCITYMSIVSLSHRQEVKEGFSYFATYGQE